MRRTSWIYWLLANLTSKCQLLRLVMTTDSRWKVGTVSTSEQHISSKVTSAPPCCSSLPHADKKPALLQGSNQASYQGWLNLLSWKDLRPIPKHFSCPYLVHGFVFRFEPWVKCALKMHVHQTITWKISADVSHCCNSSARCTWEFFCST